MKAKTAVIKIGTNAITHDDGSLDMNLLEDFVRQISEVKKEYNVLLVSSGAMGAGMAVLNRHLEYDDVTNRQLHAVVGQVKLMEIYSGLFREHDVTVAQMLATRQDFENRDHFLNTKNCINSLFRENIIPIMNENDFVCIDELMFTDNDELAGIVSKMLFADTFLILSSVDGVYDEDGVVISEFNFDEDIPENIITKDTSSFGKGGMQTKFNIAQEVARHGTAVYIANGGEKNIVERILAGEHVGSHFKPQKKSD